MHTRPFRRIFVIILFLLVLAAAITYLYLRANPIGTVELKASGTVEAVEIVMGAEISGRVAEVLVDKGDQVKPGDLLIRLDDELLKAQKQKANAALETAKAALEASRAASEMAQASVDVAKSKYELELSAARLRDKPTRIVAWTESNPTEFKQPVWYFNQGEQIAAIRTEVEKAMKGLDTERSNLATILKDASNADVIQAEIRLSQAQAAFLTARDVLDRGNAQNVKELKDSAQSNYDAAKTELDAAQSAYTSILSSKSATDVLEARARVSVAQERYDAAVDRLDALLTGTVSLQVTAAEAVLKQAETSVVQAQANIVQAEKAVALAQAESDLIGVQLGKLEVKAEVAGVILTRNVEPGEVLQAAAAAMTIGKLDELTVTVYVSEDLYGKIKLGDHANMATDSFPNEVFDAVVKRIADKAEYTPRNVQTNVGRRTTVFAVELKIDSSNGKLKPGMPADILFK